jgi:hypothetical protein
MSFKSQTYRVLIASPSDMAEERQAATEAVNDWNAQHAAAESVVLLPVKWETHAKPQAGMGPQEAINYQLVRDCDIVVGLFWTKIGTSTGVAESGTVEEIDQFVASGRPALLYFSSRPIDPNRIDLKQHRKLKSFKDATYKKALTGGFSRVDELRQTLLRDLMTQVRELNANRPSRSSAKLDQVSKITDLILTHRRNKITPEEFLAYREEFLGPGRRSKPCMSDGGGAIEPEKSPHSEWALQTYRVLNVIDNQVGTHRKRNLMAAYNSVQKGAYWGIGTAIAEYNLPDSLSCDPKLTADLAGTPTRLAALDDPAQEVLIDWGYAICDAAIRRYFPQPNIIVLRSSPYRHFKH